MAETLERRRDFDRRVRLVSFRLPERRLGYQRRLPQGGRVRRAYHLTLDGLRDNTRVLVLALTAIIWLNSADLFLTAHALDAGAIEVNPLMAHLFESDEVLAGAFKLLVGLAVALGIWMLRRYRQAMEAALFLVVVLSGLIVYQVNLAYTLGVFS